MSAAPLVLLHGFTGAPASFDGVRALLPGGRTVAPSLLGHAPDLGAATGVTDFDGEVDRLGQLLDRAGVTSQSPAHLVGYSLGARLSLGLLCHPQHGRRFVRATLIDGHAGLTDPAEREARVAADEAWVDLLLNHGLLAFVAAWEAQPLFHTQRLLPEPVRRSQREQRLRHDPAGLALALRALTLGRMPSLWAHLSRLELPVQVLVGSEDHKFRALGERLTAALPQGRLGCIAGAGHNLLLEAPAAVAAALGQGDDR